MKQLSLFCALAALHVTMLAQDPVELRSWLRNTNGRVGYNNIPADVQQVRYSANFVYINSTGIPAYTIGPWPGNPNVPSNQNFVFKFSRNPTVQSGTKRATPLGSIGVWTNGVALYNPLDAFSYNNQNIWHQNAGVVEAPSMDACNGHPQQQGAYHHHFNPQCLYTASPSTHSPLIGFAFDGFPIYGAYAYANTNGTGGIRRIKTSYRKRAITQRTTLPDGTVLQPSQYGPAVSTTYPLGYYVEDFEYVSGLGDLDAYNGRTAVTPEYPSGIYAYYVALDSTLSPAYPYIIGPSYNGVVVEENITTRGRVTITEAVQTYSPSTSVNRADETPTTFTLEQNYPNPFNPTTRFEFRIPARPSGGAEGGFVSLKVFDVVGREVATLINEQLNAGTYDVTFDASEISSGVYYYRLQSGGSVATRKMLLSK